MDYVIESLDHANVHPQTGTYGVRTDVFHNIDSINSDGQFIQFVDMNGILIAAYNIQNVITIKQAPQSATLQVPASVFNTSPYYPPQATSIQHTANCGVYVGKSCNCQNVNGGSIGPSTSPTVDPFARSMKGISRP